MKLDLLALPAAILVLFTAVSLLLSRNWRWAITALAAQYLGCFVLVAVAWPLEMAVVKVVAGWMAGAVLGIAMSEALAASPESLQDTEKFSPSGWLFQLLAAAMVLMVIFSLVEPGRQWVPGLTLAQSLGGLALIGLGLLHLGFKTQPFRVCIGLLTILSGFEILYAAVESSTLVAGLLAAVNLGLALVGAYLIMAPTMEETE